ncbi:MAG: porin [Alphaproteobacteria bacterium]
MKKLLLASVAMTGLAFAAPAHADVELEVGGYFKGYGVFLDSDTSSDKDFDFIRDTEIHIGGETTLDNGLTVGAHFEVEVDGDDDSAINESYVYFSGNWGRVNFGKEDGASYLLQVAAPSADSNIDGIRQYVSPFASELDYDADITGKSDRLTYLSPVFSGFQVGASFAPDSGSADDFGVGSDGTSAEEAYDVAARYEGQFQNVGVIAGAGYSTVINDTATGDDADSFNVGLDLDIAAFGIGAIYLSETDTADVDTDTFVIGLDYTTGPFKLGASYLNQDIDDAADTETDRYTAGVVYNYGPGMSFRGSVQFVDEETTTTDTDATAVTLGTQINF